MLRIIDSMHHWHSGSRGIWAGFHKRPVRTPGASYHRNTTESEPPGQLKQPDLLTNAGLGPSASAKFYDYLKTPSATPHSAPTRVFVDVYQLYFSLE